MIAPAAKLGEHCVTVTSVRTVTGTALPLSLPVVSAGIATTVHTVTLGLSFLLPLKVMKGSNDDFRFHRYYQSTFDRRADSSYRVSR